MTRTLALALTAALLLSACAGHQVLSFETSAPNARVRVQRAGDSVADERALPARYELSYPRKAGPWALVIGGSVLFAAGLTTVVYSLNDNSGGFEDIFYVPLLSVGSALAAGGGIWAALQPSKRYQVTVETPTTRDAIWLQLPVRGQDRRHARFYFDGTRLRPTSESPAL
ncbi:MAG: hypothetical protein AAGD10_17365 [Myxococcota bacterium]